MKLIIVRHGVTLENDANIAQGQTDGTLSDNGRRENEQLGRRMQQFQFRSIYSSPLERAWETAETIREYNPATSLIADDRLMERHLGILQGSPYPIPYSEADLYDGMETVSSMAERLNLFLNEIKTKHINETVVLVSHGYLIKVLLSIIHHWPVASFYTVSLMKNSSFAVEELN